MITGKKLDKVTQACIDGLSRELVCEWFYWLYFKTLGCSNGTNCGSKKWPWGWSARCRFWCFWIKICERKCRWYSPCLWYQKLCLHAHIERYASSLGTQSIIETRERILAMLHFRGLLNELKRKAATNACWKLLVQRILNYLVQLGGLHHKQICLETRLWRELLHASLQIHKNDWVPNLHSILQNIILHIWAQVIKKKSPKQLWIHREIGFSLPAATTLAGYGTQCQANAFKFYRGMKMRFSVVLSTMKASTL